jgi:hypothetical protein
MGKLDKAVEEAAKQAQTSSLYAGTLLPVAAFRQLNTSPLLFNIMISRPPPMRFAKLRNNIAVD